MAACSRSISGEAFSSRANRSTASSFGASSTVRGVVDDARGSEAAGVRITAGGAGATSGIGRCELVRSSSPGDVSARTRIITPAAAMGRLTRRARSQGSTRGTTCIALRTL